MKICGKDIRIKGNLVRIALLYGEGYGFLDNPEEALKVLRGFGRRIDLFTFIQELSELSPRHIHTPTPMEWDNFVTLRISTFDDRMAGLRPHDQDDGA